MRKQIIKIRRDRMREGEEEEGGGEEYVHTVIMFMLSHAPSHSVQRTYLLSNV
jgi:hypothetical protein